MTKKKSSLVLFVILLFTFIARADVPPDFGEVREKIDLVIETAEDLSDYRFFLDFYGDFKEIQVNGKGRTVISPMGGGARYATGKILAVPVKNLPTDEAIGARQKVDGRSPNFNPRQAAGVIELGNHYFTKDLSITERATFVPPIWTIERDGTNLKASVRYDEKAASVSRTLKYGTIAAGIFLTLAILASGVFLFRKVSKKVIK